MDWECPDWASGSTLGPRRGVHVPRDWNSSELAPVRAYVYREYTWLLGWAALERCSPGAMSRASYSTVCTHSVASPGETWSEMLVVIGFLFLLPLAVFAQETTSTRVESVPLRADKSFTELYGEVVTLVDPSNSGGVRLEIQSYRQEVTIKSTLRNVDGDSTDVTWQNKVINAATTAAERSVELGEGTVTWSWATSAPVRNLDSRCSTQCSVQAKFVMTWTPDIDDTLQWRDRTAARALRASDFETEFETEISESGAAGDADTVLQTPVITTVSFACFIICCLLVLPPACAVACTPVWVAEKLDNDATGFAVGRCRVSRS